MEKYVADIERTLLLNALSQCSGVQTRAADLLKIGHHGSRTSTSAELLDALQPRVALLSCGRRNRFGHPAPETVARTEAAGVRLLRTDTRSDCRVELLPEATRLWWRGLEKP